jgi:hypothetical protein
MSTTRVKDAGFLQKNIEKLIFAAGAFVLVVVLGLFILANPFKIEIGGQEVGDAGEAVAILENGDQALVTGLNKQDPLPETTIPNFRDDYTAMLNKSVNTPGKAVRLARGGLTNLAIYPKLQPPPRYAMVYPPTPVEIEYAFGNDVLDTEINPQPLIDQFRELMGRPDAGKPGQPFDMSMFVAAGDFPIWEWYQELKGDEDASPGGDNQIPVGIWHKRFGIAATALLRETWDPIAGEWTDRQIVAALPGQARILPGDKETTNPAEALARVELIRQSQPQIVRPELPLLTDFVTVQPPGGDGVGDGADGFNEFGIELDEENLGPNEARIRELEEKIEALEERRREREERQRPREDRPDRPRPRPGRVGPDDFGDPGDFGDPRDTRERRDPIQRQIDRLQEEIERRRPEAEKERQERQERAELRRQREEEARRRREEARLNNPNAILPDEFASGLDFEGVQLEEGATIRVWAADPTMRPGKTYRYKLLVATINPLYAVPRLEEQQLQENQARAAIFPTQAEIEAMDWIGPITTEPRARFFFTSGGENRAKVDVYRRHDGQLYSEDFDVSPGDPIGGTVTIKDKQDLVPPFDVNMGVGAILVDIEARRTLSGKTDYVMIYMDEDGNLHERAQSDDTNHPDKRELDREVKDGPTYALRPEEDEDEFDDGFGGGRFDGF